MCRSQVLAILRQQKNEAFEACLQLVKIIYFLFLINLFIQTLKICLSVQSYC